MHDVDFMQGKTGSFLNKLTYRHHYRTIGTNVHTREYEKN